jgi:hypothetical protein
MHGIARRGLLGLPAKLFALLMLRRSNAADAGPTIRLNEFMALSVRLTARTGLDPDLGRTYLTGLLSDPRNEPRLEALAHGRASDAELEREIILNWYTGVYKAAGESRLATHSGALLWKALGTPAPGTCSGKTGFWSKPPAGTA